MVASCSSLVSSSATEIRTGLTAESVDNHLNSIAPFFVIGCGLGLTLQVVRDLLFEPLRNATMRYLLTDHMDPNPVILLFVALNVTFIILCL